MPAAVPQIPIADAIAFTIVVPGCPKRSAATITNGNSAKWSGVAAGTTRVAKISQSTTTRPASSVSASTIRARGQRAGGHPLQTSKSGATTRMLIASPSHHTNQIRPNAVHGQMSARHRLATPIVALIVVLSSAPPPKSSITKRIRSSDGRTRQRWSSHAPTVASRVFPVAMPAATAIGATEAFASSAPIQTPGQTRRPRSITAASAMPVGGHTTVTCGATNASSSPSFAAAKYTAAIAIARPRWLAQRGNGALLRAYSRPARPCGTG